MTNRKTKLKQTRGHPKPNWNHLFKLYKCSQSKWKGWFPSVIGSEISVSSQQVSKKSSCLSQDPVTPHSRGWLGPLSSCIPAIYSLVKCIKKKYAFPPHTVKNWILFLFFPLRINTKLTQRWETNIRGGCAKSSRSVHVVKVIGDAEGFINTAVVEGKLLLCPGLDGKHVVWKQKFTAAM